jgi:hypothetical protein
LTGYDLSGGLEDSSVFSVGKYESLGVILKLTYECFD